MSDDRELDDGLAAFDQLNREMAETNRLLRTLQANQKARETQEAALSAKLQSGLQEATGASQNALQAAKAQIRSSLLWVALTALLTLLAASGTGYLIGQRVGIEQGQAEGYQSARNEQAAASWANTPAGQRAYALDQLGSLDMLAGCKGEGWKVERQHGQRVCIPYATPNGTAGWFIP
jgi:hypothetical protein